MHEHMQILLKASCPSAARLAGRLCSAERCWTLLSVAGGADMEHVAGGMNNKHVIHRWCITNGIFEGPLEGKSAC
jgi:hypothetical protein